MQQQFPFLPAGCHVQLDQKATEIVLRSLREAIPSRWPSKVEELRSLRRTHPDIDLAGFLDESGLELDDVYDGAKSWSDLQAAAGAPVLPEGPHETELRRAVGRLLHIDDPERLATYQHLFSMATAPSVDAMPERERRLVRMLVAAITQRAITKDTSVQDALDLLRAHPQVRAELVQLLAVLDTQVDHLHAPLTTHPWNLSTVPILAPSARRHPAGLPRVGPLCDAGSGGRLSQAAGRFCSRAAARFAALGRRPLASPIG